MPTAEANLGSEQRLDIPIREKGIQEMQNVLSRCLPSFYWDRHGIVHQPLHH